ncbi:hypothetical protein UPYG_G00206470 [Umbra pygmaea]|uniref:tRNA-intron lyase n=1 Tax=Umbra pygmaea TaxID=75934 RepID=A0ABD0WJ64_UMBPY
MAFSEPNITKHVSKEDGCEEGIVSQLIEISKCGSTPLLWRADDLKAAREVGLVGTPVGSLARQPRQNIRLGRPLELLPEEGRLLVDMGKAAVCPGLDSSCRDPKVSPECTAVPSKTGKQFSGTEYLGFRGRKMTLLRALTEKQNGGTRSREDTDVEVRNRLKALDRSFSFPRMAMAVQLCTARAGLAHCPEERQFLTADWPLPQNEHSESRFRVFRDLRCQGFYLTSAGKFGGDYLVYPGELST